VDAVRRRLPHPLPKQRGTLHPQRSIELTGGAPSGKRALQRSRTTRRARTAFGAPRGTSGSRADHGHQAVQPTRGGGDHRGVRAATDLSIVEARHFSKATRSPRRR
jgi:hypothetical protein